ncbi:MAG: glycoside hydrolase family 44 [Cytophagaceae bacterium BCCC1]|nr:MAG: glycoside hydrolase family 44 [Cytophagaceae bacterium BCCC1]
MKKLLFLLVLFSKFTIAQVNVSVFAKSKIAKVSPYIFGRNNSFSSTNPNSTLSSEDFTRIKDAGVQFFRESGGNNSTKYNWRKKLSSHPDWYNNVYVNDWDKTAKSLQKNFPNAQGMWSFQLIGKAAKTSTANFNDYGYNKSQWWEGVNQNLAGNGELNPTGNKAKKEGDANLYLEDWPADSTVGILKHWFGQNGIGLDKEKVQYWSMDNEPEIWNGTHDDVVNNQFTAEELIQSYIKVAKKARAAYPAIKLCGPVTANEWQWYNWSNGPIEYNGKKYPWIEYFLLRIAEEESKSGVRLLDVIDIHFYPNNKNPQEIVQLHRVFFDQNYAFSGANGVKNVNGSWDNSQNKEFIFGRINGWLNKYFGENHGRTLGLTELGFDKTNPNVTAVTYASIMGEFMRNNVEIFTPWSWETGMWETLHLFSKNTFKDLLKTESADESIVSVYSTINEKNDQINLILVNRSLTSIQKTNVKINDFIIDQSVANRIILKNIPNSETFFSESKNAKTVSKVNVINNELYIDLEPLSVSSITLSGILGTYMQKVLAVEPTSNSKISVYPNPSSNSFILKNIETEISHLYLTNLGGLLINDRISLSPDFRFSIPPSVSSGVYLLNIEYTNKDKTTLKLIIN